MEQRRRGFRGLSPVLAGTSNNINDTHMQTTPDWHLVAEALSSLEFLRDIVEPENQSREIREVIADHINERNGIAPLSRGTLIAFAYIAIVYPTERMIFGLPGQLITHQFIESKPSKNNHELLRNLRNALSHGDFEVSEDRILFQNSEWQAWTSHEDLTVFLHEFYVKIVAQHYIGRANDPRK